MDKKEVFKKFIEENEVLIVDKNPGSRNRLLKIMYDLGSKRHMIHTAGELGEAEQIINTKNIRIVLSDYFITGGSGFDLFKMLREKKPQNNNNIFILVTSNISQTAVAKAAEEDVDSFIIKPYTIQSIQENLISTIASKVQPSEYLVKIEEGKGLMLDGKYPEAIDVLKIATGLHQKPSLALFYIGQAEYFRNYVQEAKGSYNTGLSFNNIHFKCLIGLYDLFMRENHYHEAYQVVKKVARYFPANPERLTQIVRLAIKTENFQDMQFYYEIFTSLEERTSILVNYIGAGMYVSGKHSLMNNNLEDALQYFDNIAVSCSEFTKFVRAMITLLVEYDKADEAMKYLGRFPAGSDDQEDFLVSEYLVNSKRAVNPNFLVKKGLDLYNRQIRDYNCMRVMLSAMKSSGYKEDKINTFQIEMISLWPDKASISA